MGGYGESFEYGLFRGNPFAIDFPCPDCGGSGEGEEEDISLEDIQHDALGG